MEHRQLTWHERGQLWLRLGIRIVLTVGGLALLLLVGRPLISLFMPFVLAFLLAWLLNPLVRTLQKRVGLSRRLISLLLVLLIFGVAGGVLTAFCYSIANEVISLANNWQVIWEGFQVVMEQVVDYCSKLFELLPHQVGTWVNGILEEFISWFQTAVPNWLTGFASHAGNLAMSVPSFAVALVVFIMGSYFITADYPHIRFLVTRRMSCEVRGFFRQMKSTAMAAFGGYVRAQLILSLVVFFILLAGFVLIKQPYSVLLAFLLAVLDFIPIVGAGTVMVPWAFIALVTGDFRSALELMVIWGAIALFRRVGEPKILGDQTGLSPILSLVSIYVGMRLAGVLGMILGPIVCLVVINIGKTGVFDGVMTDLKLAARDISALLSGGKPKEF